MKLPLFRKRPEPEWKTLIKVVDPASLNNLELQQSVKTPELYQFFVGRYVTDLEQNNVDEARNAAMEYVFGKEHININTNLITQEDLARIELSMAVFLATPILAENEAKMQGFHSMPTNPTMDETDMRM